MQKGYILISLLTFFGAINIVLKKVQNVQVINRETGELFYHPYLHTSLFFIGQFIAGLYYLFYFRNQKRLVDPQENNKPIAKHYQVIIPTIFQMLNVLFANFALNLVDGSILQISRGGVVIVTAVLSKIFLHRIYTNRSIMGCAIAFVGIISVQIASVHSARNKSNELADNELMGYGFVLVSIICNSIGFILEKRVFDKYRIHPLKFVSIQGFYGFIFITILSIGIQYVPCPWANRTQCVCLSQTQCYLENVFKFLSGLISSRFMVTITICYLILTSFVSSVAITLLKQVSPVSRALGNANRTFFIWIFNMILTLTIANEFPEYRLESTSIDVNIFKAIGFSLLVWGVILYHDNHTQPESKKIKQN